MSEARPLVAGTAQFVRVVFDVDISSESSFDLGDMVINEVPSGTPLALISVPGYDASYRVENLIKNTGTRSASVVMGSPEGFTLADQVIAAASRQGSWVLLKNVHLASTWLGQLEKKLQTLNPHRNFRLFLTMEANRMGLTRRAYGQVGSAAEFPGSRVRVRIRVHALLALSRANAPESRARV
ncbi:dynein heavy chain and region D6 of dynein motor-domain-containing protein [Mycena galericulata]|nr:dynein heavy chain and region D6 of dynein motor-domain-containing protein [Mycena galericulata]KAJ7478066.1 dynein heavy chain and region D6 of dynein motor-domain-containing protein [Mycena galericulata]